MQSFETSFSQLASIARIRAGRILGSPHDAEEVAQEALLRAHTSWETIAPFAEPWVSRVSTNLAIDRLRRRRPMTEDRDATRADETSAAALRLDVRRALESLPNRQREAVVLRHVLDLSERDTADAMGCSVGAVKRHLHRAMEALRGAPSLAAFRTDAIEIYGERLMFIWQDYFTAAVEPEAGWPVRPWDHRLFLTETGEERLAVDDTGNPLIDADGDEIFTGPGVDYVPVKNLKQGLPPETGEGDPPQAGLDDDLLAALDRAHAWSAWHGDPWVGVAQVVLAILELCPASLDGVEGVNTDLDRFNRAYASFCEGPFADARVAIVNERRAADWRPNRIANEAERTLTDAVIRNLTAIAAEATAGGRLASPADFARHDLRRAPGPSAVGYLLARWG